MTTMTVRSGALRLTLLCSLVFLSVFTLEASSAAESGRDFNLKGVIISPSDRSALVNSEVVREGERWGNVEILAIRMDGAEIRMGSRRLTVPVGSTADWDLASRLPPPSLATQPAPSISSVQYGPVKTGETLSEIAENLLVDDITMNQMMIALYDANQGAFAGNINVLREGAILQIPDQDVLHRRTRLTATAEVLRHTSTWQGGNEEPVQLASIAKPDVYGPVTRGETLSGIAVSLSRNGTTLNQMMIALFEANPQAFDNNINLLRAGAVLRIPDEATMPTHSYETATAAVTRHMDALRHDFSQVRQPAIVDSDLVTFLGGGLQPPGVVLLPTWNNK